MHNSPATRDKECHAELVKHEVRIITGDLFAGEQPEASSRWSTIS